MECITAVVLAIVYTHSCALDFQIADTELKAFRTKVKQQINPKQVKYIRFGWKCYCPNRELLSQAVINIISSFIRCVPSAASATRSNRMQTIGGRSQV